MTLGGFVTESNGNGHGVLVRASADTGASRDYYALCVADDAASGGSHTVRLQRVANGTTTTLYSASRTYTNGDTIELEATGTGATVTLRMYQNGVQFGGDQSDTDATRITAAGKPGLVMRAGNSGMTLDDWEGGDVTASAPVLSAPTGSPTGPTQATIGVTSDTAPTATAISYQILPAASGAPSAATIVGAPDGTITTGTAGALTKAITSLTTNTAVKVHFAQGTTSNVVSSASFTPSTLAWSGTYPNQSGVAGAAFVHTGSVPSPTGGIGTKSYSATGLGASGLTMNTSTGQLQGTCGTAGTYTVTPTVVDQSTVGSSIPQTQSLASFTLTISAAGTAPTVSANPSNLTVADGATATFSGGFNGSPTLSLQWQEFIGGVWTAMSGQTTVNLSLGVVDLLDDGRSFRLGGTNPYGGPIYTSSATLTVTASSVGTITSDVFADWGDDTPLASTNIEFVTLLAITDDTVALQLVDQVTNTAGRLIIADAAITTGDDYLLVTRNADGSICGCKAYTAT